MNQLLYVYNLLKNITRVKIRIFSEARGYIGAMCLFYAIFYTLLNLTALRELTVYIFRIK